MESRIIKSACRMCRRGCGIDVHITDGRITDIQGTPENPASSGALCVKARAIADYVNSPDRLRHPMKREGNSFRQISRDEAIDTIAVKLDEIKRRYGAAAFAVYLGESASQCDATSYVRRFLDVYGSPNLLPGGSLCYRSIPIACKTTFGKPYLPEPENARCIVLWGTNPYHTNRQQTTQILKAQKTGAKLIVVDPRRTFFAARADIHIQPQPGSDCLLALAMLNVIVSEGLNDKKFTDEWTTGFDRLKEHLAAFTPEAVEEQTKVAPGLIKEAARMFAATAPACIIPGIGLYHQASGVQSLRAAAFLQALTGNIDTPGGWVAPVALRLDNLSLPEKVAGRPLGEEKFPLFIACSPRMEGQAAALCDALQTEKPHPVKALFVAGGNPALSWPGTATVLNSLKKLEFLVVMDVRMTETARLANIVLPAATFAETTELHTYIEATVPYAILRQSVTESPDCFPDWKFWFLLAERMGYGDYFPWANEEEAIGFALKPSGITLKDLQDNPAGVFYGTKQYGTYKQKGFPTPSGKVELYSAKLAELGYSPLPLPVESTDSTAAEYPLSLITGARYLEFTHSQFRDVAPLRRSAPEPEAEVHPETAKQYGIADKQLIFVETKNGKIEIKARLTEDIKPGVVSIPFGWHEPNTNVLTDWLEPDPISGLPCLVGIPCKIGIATHACPK